MKIKNKIIAGILSVILPLSIAGCTGKKADTVPASNSSGRYVEEEITLPMALSGDHISELSLCNGKPAFVDWQNRNLYRQNETKTSFTADSFKSEERSFEFTGCAVSPRDECYVFHIIPDNIPDTDLEAGCYECLCGIGKPGEEWKSFPIGKFFYIESAECSNDGKLFALANGENGCQIIKIDTKAETSDVIFSYPYANSVPSLDISGDYLVSVYDNDILFYNYVSDSLEKTPEAITSFIQEQKICELLNRGSRNFDICAGEDNSIYIACESGLYRYVINGNQVEQLIDGMTCHIGNPSWEINSVITEDPDSFIIAYSNSKVMRYRYDKNAGNKTDSELNIFSISKNETAMYAIDEYRSLYPNVLVNYKAAEDYKDYNEVIEQLNDEMLSDNPPDVIITDDLDIDDLIKNNMLLNLTDYKNAILSENNILENISIPLNNGEWYTMPCRFSLPYIVGKQSDIDKISNTSDFMELSAKQYSENEDVGLWYTEPKDLLDKLLVFSWNDIVAQNGIDSECIEKLLAKCMELCESAYSKPRFHFSNVSAYMFSHYLDSNVAFASSASSVKELMILNTIDTAKSSAGYRIDMGTENSYIPSCSLSICSKSENIDKAITFLQTAISENVQRIESTDGLPVNTAVIEGWPNRKYNSQSTFNDDEKHLYLPSSTKKLINIRNIRNGAYEIFYNLIKELDTPLCDKGNIKNTILFYGDQYLSKRMSLEEAVKSIEDTIDEPINY